MTVARLCLLGLLLTLWACGAQPRLSALPPQTAAPLLVQFGARAVLAGQSLPVQGALQMTESGGSLALILPHGRTLGLCRYLPRAHTERAELASMRCEPAAGLDFAAQRLLLRVGLALYRMLPGLEPQAEARQLAGEGWSARLAPAGNGLTAAYREGDGLNMDVNITEICRP